jgi:hypothetical protein
VFIFIAGVLLALSKTCSGTERLEEIGFTVPQASGATDWYCIHGDVY